MSLPSVVFDMTSIFFLLLVVMLLVCHLCDHHHRHLHHNFTFMIRNPVQYEVFFLRFLYLFTFVVVFFFCGCCFCLLLLFLGSIYFSTSTALLSSSLNINKQFVEMCDRDWERREENIMIRKKKWITRRR